MDSEDTRDIWDEIKDLFQIVEEDSVEIYEYLEDEDELEDLEEEFIAELSSFGDAEFGLAGFLAIVLFAAMLSVSIYSNYFAGSII